MLRTGWFGNASNARHTFTLGFLTTAVLLWIWNYRIMLSSLLDGPPTSAPEVFSVGGEEATVVPRLNTSWHAQMALEMVNDRTGLTAVDTPHGPLNRKRVALLMENRPLPYLIPLLLHFIAVVPPEWSFRFMGSEESVAMMEGNPTIQRYMQNKKLFVDLIPYEVVSAISDYNSVNHLLTRPWLYEEWLWPAEWLFLFQDDSMICSASKKTLNDFVDEDWSFLGVSVQSTSRPHAMGGGFSLRKVQHLVQLLHTYPMEQWALDGNHASEDYYFSMALFDKPWAKQPIGEQAIKFGVVIDFHSDPEEMPLGFHPYSSDGMFRGARGQENQQRAYAYCPELAIISVGRWDCECHPNGARPGGLGG